MHIHIRYAHWSFHQPQCQHSQTSNSKIGQHHGGDRCQGHDGQATNNLASTHCELEDTLLIALVGLAAPACVVGAGNGGEGMPGLFSSGEGGGGCVGEACKL